MADTGEEIIGGVGVTISGDYSSLAASYATAQSDAEAAGQAVAEAFNEGVGGVADAADIVTAALDPIGPAADGAGESLDTFAGAATQAGESSQEASGGLASMAEQLAAVAEALVITEGLKELGTEALGAADSITHASIALTTITGSGDQAHETIEGLEQLGMQDGLAMPSLLTAATRMQQLLGPGTDVVGLLGTIANGAATMGTDIGSAADMFDRMAANGQVMSRSLGSVGLTMQGLADAANQVNPALGATATNLTTVFKTMDQSDRVAALQIAFQGLGGVAQQVAEQTFGGQWQQLADQWEAIMVQVGQALLPVITDLLDFAKTDIAPFIQSLVSGFNELPGPIKDTAVAVALVAAAVVPLAGVAAAAAIGLNGLAEAATLLGLSSAEAAPTVAGLGAASEGAGVSFGLMEASGLTLGTFLGITLVSGLAAAAFGFADLEKSINSAQSAWLAAGGAVGDMKAYIVLANQAIQEHIDALKGASLSEGDAAAATELFSKYLDAGTISSGQFKQAVLNIAEAVKSFKIDDLSTAIQQFSLGVHVLTDSGMTPLDASIEKVSLSVAAAQTKFDQARNTFNALSQSLATGKPVYDGLVASAEEVAKAHQDMDAAAKAAGISLAPMPGSMDAITAAANKLADGTGFVVSAQQEQANESTVAASSMDLATTAYDRSTAKLDLLVSALHDAQTADDGSAAARQRVITAEENVQKAYADSQKALKDLNTTETNYATMIAPQVDAAARQMLQGLIDTAEAVGPVISKMSGLDDEIQALGRTIPNFGVQAVNISTGPLVGLQSALKEATSTVADLNGKMLDGQAVGQQYESALKRQLDAQVALDEELAVLNTGLQGATDAYSLAKDAVAAAQAKVDDLTAAFQAGIATYAQVQSAQKALASAQTALNVETGTGANLVTNLSNAYPNLTAGVNATTSAIQAQTTALAADVMQLQSVAAAVQSVESDIAGAVGSANAAGGFSGGGAGWKSGVIGYGTFGQPIESITYTPNMTQDQFNGMVQQFGLAQAEATEATFNASTGYTSNYSYTGPPGVGKAPAATSTSGAAGGSSAAGGGTSSTGTGLQSPIIVGTPIDTAGGGGTTTVTATTPTSTVPVTATSSGGGTSAIDGGSYPAVTAHQAAGEVWSVTMSAAGTASAGVTPAAISQTITNTVNAAGGTGGLSSAVSGVGTSIQLLGNNLVASVAASTAATQAVSEAIAGLVTKIATGSIVSSGAGPVAVGGSGQGASTGLLTNTPLPIAGGGGPSALSGTSQQMTLTVNAPITVNGSGNPAQVAQQVAQQLVQQLFAAGARLTR